MNKKFMITKLLSLALLSNMYAFSPCFFSRNILNNDFNKRQTLKATHNNAPAKQKHNAIDIPEVQKVQFDRPTRQEYENFAKTFKAQPSICNTGAVRSLIQLRSEKLQAQNQSVKNTLKVKLASAQEKLYGVTKNLKQHAHDAWITAQKAGKNSYNYASPYIQQSKQVCSDFANHAKGNAHKALKEGQKLEQNMVKEYKKSQKLAEKKYLAAKKQTKKMYRNTLKAAKSYNGKALRFARTRKGFGVAGFMLGAGAATAGAMTYNAFTQPAQLRHINLNNDGQLITL